MPDKNSQRMQPLQRPSSAVTWVAPYDYYHDRYQEYYSTGIRAALHELGCELQVRSIQRFPGLLRVLRRLRYAHRLTRVMTWAGPALDALTRVLAGRGMPPFGRFHPLAGQYEFVFSNGRAVKLVVDSSDAGEIADEGLLDRCDVYAKSNCRQDGAYPPRVVPIANGNPIVLPHLPLMRELRRRAFQYDCVCVVRVWGGRDETSGVEHNLRLLEALNKARCRKFLLAYLVAGDVAAQERRLQSQGISTTRTPVPLRELWEVSAASCVNVIRLGMHNCVPWRFTDMLAMGACVVFDQAPQTVWPVPLVPEQHFLDLGLLTPPEGGQASDEAYAAIPAKIDEIVADLDRVQRIRSAAAAYYDDHVEPGAIGRYLLHRVCDGMRKEAEPPVAANAR